VEVAQAHWGRDPWTTGDLAEHLGVPEHQVRGLTVWLVCGGVAEPAGTVRRRDQRGRPYKAALYRLTGAPLADRRIPRDAGSRRAVLSAPVDVEADVLHLATSAPWGAPRRRKPVP
jgi:predicted ArsR family transcriptional regulator